MATVSRQASLHNLLEMEALWDSYITISKVMVVLIEAMNH
jgi:hypothetical protein